MNATDDPKPNIHQRMLAVMRDISYVQKSDKTVNNQYRFVTHDAVTAKVRGALLAHGIVATTDVLKHEQDGNRTEVDVQVDFVNVDNPTDRVTIRAFGYGIDPQDKGPGKAISYAVKYAYLKAFALETGDDPERDSIDHEPAKKPSKAIPANIEGKERYEELTDDEKDYYRSHARELEKLDAKDGYSYFRSNGFTDEDWLILWGLLPSKIRNPIRDEMRRANGVKPPAMAEQA